MHSSPAIGRDGTIYVGSLDNSLYAINPDGSQKWEFETGDERVLLNYGHTVGHAIEKVSGYGNYLHGEAVAIGMMAAAGIAERLGMIDRELVDRQRRVLQSYDLPVRGKGLDVDSLIDATKSDKKSRSGTIRWVLLEGPGKATTRRDVPENVVRESIEAILD